MVHGCKVNPLVWSIFGWSRTEWTFCQYKSMPQGQNCPLVRSISIHFCRSLGTYGKLNVISSSLSSNSEHMPQYGSKFDFLKQFLIDLTQSLRFFVEIPWRGAEITLPLVRSACLYGQFSLDKTLTLQAGATVLRSTNSMSDALPSCLEFNVIQCCKKRNFQKRLREPVITYSSCLTRRPASARGGLASRRTHSVLHSTIDASPR